MAFFHSNFMLQIPHQDHDHNNQPSTSLAPINPQQFNGVGSLLGKRASMAFSGMNGCDEEMDHHQQHQHQHHHHHHGGEDELSDDGSQLGEKKRRLSMEQVRTLEKNFELGNKLEPERKMQLARALGLQPRQVAIWFQNRRARWKTKTLEKDYEILKRQFESVKAQNDALQAHNLKLHAQILALKTREPTESINLNKETEGSCSNRSENSSDIIKLEISRNNNNNNNPAIDSPSLFPSPSSGMIRPPNVAQQLFHNSSRTEMQCGAKMDQIVNSNKEESLCNIMFSGMDDQAAAAAGFWPWLDQQHFN